MTVLKETPFSNNAENFRRASTCTENRKETFSTMEDRVQIACSESQDVEKGQIEEQKQCQLSGRLENLMNRLSEQFSIYQQLFTFILLSNLAAGLALFLCKNESNEIVLQNCTTVTAINLTVAILVRQEYIVNALFTICWSIPKSAPLKFRLRAARVYEYGGIHTGCATCAVLWFLVLTGYLTPFSIARFDSSIPMLVIDYTLLLFLLAITLSALPNFRMRHHNTFERLHRFAGWISLALFWALLLLFINQLNRAGQAAFSQALVQAPAFWLLIISTIHIILPWLRLRRVKVRPEYLSDHAIRLHLSERVPLFRGVAISASPLSQWHSFAAIPSRDGLDTSILISNAGDWTKNVIRSPRSYYYMRGFPRTGVLAMAQLFRSVVFVATGSGIGPCLGVMLDIPETQCRVIWSTPDPLKTYGSTICDSVLSIDGNAHIIDTRREGRPNLVQLAYDLFVASESEAVFCVSNKRVTFGMIKGLRKHKVNVFSPIFDS